MRPEEPVLDVRVADAFYVGRLAFFSRLPACRAILAVRWLVTSRPILNVRATSVRWLHSGHVVSSPRRTCFAATFRIARFGRREVSADTRSNSSESRTIAGGGRGWRRVAADVGPLELVGLVVLGIATASTDAEAYIDPGTGSYIFQLAVAGALAAMFTLKRYWRRVRDFLRGGRGASKPSDSSGAGDAKVE